MQFGSLNLVTRGVEKMKLFLILSAIFCFLIIVVAVFIWSGSYNVAASEPHWGITHWLLGKVRQRSIAALG